MDNVKVLKIPKFCEFWRSCYTWKTYILNTPLAEQNLYLDAGNQVLRPLDDLFVKIEVNGYLAVSQGRTVHIADITPKEYMDLFGMNESDSDREIITAGIFGFDRSNKLKNITNILYSSGKSGLCLGFSPTEQWKNKGVNRTDFVREAKMFRHDTTLLSLILIKHIKELVVEDVKYFDCNRHEDKDQYIWNFRMNYSKLEFIGRFGNSNELLGILSYVVIVIMLFLKKIKKFLKHLS